MGATLATPQPASACGGFFCQNVPMDQAGENLLFAVEGDGTLTTHVQILYQGEADAFAWILPLPSVPTSIAVGSDELFRQLAARTAARFETTSRTEGTCRETPSCPYDDRLESDRGPFPSPGFADAGAAGPDVTVYFREAVGPYDAAVVGSGSADELFAWLDDNDYDIPDVSRPIVAEYVAARHVFVAVRLLANASTREIQPLVLRYAEGQPCVPLRLTAIASVPDMPIIAYFLGDALATPNNYSRVEPTYDDVRLWREGASYYPTYISNQVDDAGGRGFVTDYAGPRPDGIALELASVLDLASTSEPGAYLQQLRSRGFVGDSQLLGILERFLPPPAMYAGDPSQYYNCLWGSGGLGDHCGYTGGFDPGALTDALERQLVVPRRDAQAMLARHARLTRLYTTMDAAEMTMDPTFVLDPGLPDVSNVHTATIVTECSASHFEWSAPQRIELPSGTTASWREGVAYPGSDAEYCEDMNAGAFTPWNSVENNRTAATRRAIRPAGGGARCSTSAAGTGGTTGVLLAGLAAIALVIARRRI